jgi:hypothetical protein
MIQLLDMTIDRLNPDILIFDPPPQSIQHFRAVHRLAIALVTIYFAASFILLLLGSILLFDLMLRSKIYGMAKIDAPIVCGFVAVFASLVNPLVVYILFKIEQPVLVRSCIFDRHAGELSIQQYNLFDRHRRTTTIPLNKIVDIQVRQPLPMSDDFSAISLMTKQSSKPVYLFQKVSQQEISTFAMKSLLEEVAIIRKFLNLPSEPPYTIVKRPKWYKILFATPIPNDLVRSIDQNNDKLIYNLQSRRFWRKVSWKFDAIAQRIEVESRTLIGNRSKYITRLEIKSIAIKTEFLPLEVSTHQLSISAHRRQYQKQYSAILVPIVRGSSQKENRAKLKPQSGYWRIFTSTDLAMVCDLADRIQAHLNLPLDELRSTESIELEPVGAIK